MSPPRTPAKRDTVLPPPASVIESDESEPKSSRPRGRPRLDIDLEAVADVVAELYAAGGIGNVSIGQTAERLTVSRATLYRLVRTKNDLLGVLFERSTRELLAAARAAVKANDDPRERLHALIRVHVDAAIRMRGYMAVFFGGAGLPPDVYDRWRGFSRKYQQVWHRAVADAIDAGILDEDDPDLTTRLILGMCIWVSRWFRPGDGRTAEDIAEAAFKLIGTSPSEPVKSAKAPAESKKRRTR